MPWAGATQPLTTAYTISLDTAEAMGRAASDHAHRPLLKLKLTGDGDLERVEAIRSQRLDSGLRDFYEHCNGLEHAADLEGTEQLLATLLVRRLGAGAAGVWDRVEDQWVQVQGEGDSPALEGLGNALSQPPEGGAGAWHFVPLEPDSGRVLGVAMGPKPELQPDMKRAMEGLARAFGLVYKRLR